MLAEFGTLSLAEVLAPVDRARRRLRDRRRDRGSHRGREGQDQAVAVREGRDAAARRARRAKRRSRARSSARPTSPRRSQARRGGSDGAEGRQVAQGSARRRPTTASTAATSPRNSCAARANRARSITKDDLANWRVKLEEPRAHELSRHRRLQARPLDAGAGDAPGAQHPRELRPQGDGLQQRAATSIPSTRR